MNVKGFILEDEQGREFVVTCQQTPEQSGKTFALRGWQRLRLVPLQHPEWELRHIVAGVLIALDDLFKSLPRFVESIELSPTHEASSPPPLRRTPVLGRVRRAGNVPALGKLPR